MCFCDLLQLTFAKKSSVVSAHHSENAGFGHIFLSRKQMRKRAKAKEHLTKTKGHWHVLGMRSQDWCQVKCCPSHR